MRYLRLDYRLLMMIAPAWRQVSGRFESFLARLRPTASDREAAAEAVVQVSRLLCRRPTRATSKRGKITGGSPLLIGSWSKDTATCYSGSADLLLVFPGDERNGTGESRSTATGWQRAMLETAALLVARFGAVESSKDRWLSVVIAGAGNRPMRVRVLPAFECAGGGYLVPASRSRCVEGPWQQIDPAAELGHLSQADAATSGKVRHLIRMAKSWRRAANAPIAPFALELLVCEFLSVWIYHRAGIFFYDWMMRDFFFWLGGQASRRLSVPGSFQTLAIGDRWLPDAERAHMLAARAADLERDNRSDEALACWRGIFGEAMTEAIPPADRCILPPPRSSAPARIERQGR